MTADKRDASRLKQYKNFWQSKSALDGEAEEKNRLEEYKVRVSRHLDRTLFHPSVHQLIPLPALLGWFLQEVVNGYYDGATELYEFGWSSKFHFCRFYPGEAFEAALSRHEHYLSAQIGLKKGMKVLDVGCGIGGPARDLARFSGANIVGIVRPFPLSLFLSLVST